VTNVPPAAGNLRGAVDLSSLVNQPAPSGGQAPSSGPVAVPSLVVDGTDANFSAILELSSQVPVIVELYLGQPSASLNRTIVGYNGRYVLATVEVSANPQLQQAFRAQAVPTVAAIIAGRPIALYEGELGEDELRTVLEQVTQLAAQNGVSGTVTVQGGEPGSPDPEPVEEPLPPHHQEAYDKIAAGDFEGAIAEYRLAIAQNPRDQLAVAGLAQVSLLARLDAKTADEIRSAAAAQPADVDAQLLVADLDVSGGHLDDAFGRLLDLFPTLDQQDKDRVRTRLLDYFEIAGAEDPRVVAARRTLAALLY